ncbi:hypothetical protein CTheo_4335 [Ceratobasidium theobromae]|uniref:Uncharacterized protein n=1 Tax=Ceratobasidium theobromae TaxID=1582974 RepID=A0A5N5QL27_9AGAM|nr:hypothetical protein CTheo_4335 [Ceratobasidium theobromae]
MFLRRNHTALAPQETKLHPSVSPALARAFDGFFGPPARELKSTSSKRKNHTALAPTPCPGVSPEMRRAFDGFFGPPAREEARPAPATPERRSSESLPPYEPQSPLPVYTVLGRY